MLTLSVSVGGGKPQDVDSRTYNDFSRKSPREIANWAVSAVQGTAQADLFLDKKEQDKRILDTAEENIARWELNHGWIKNFQERKKRVQEEADRLRREQRRG